METQTSGDPLDSGSRVVIHKPSGHVVAGWNTGSADYPDADLQSVRPGWLVATRYNSSSRAEEVVLLGVSHPGKAREKVLRPRSRPHLTTFTRRMCGWPVRMFTSAGLPAR